MATHGYCYLLALTEILQVKIDVEVSSNLTYRFLELLFYCLTDCLLAFRELTRLRKNRRDGD